MTLSILTPMNHFFEGPIKSISLQTLDGIVQILPRYAPYVTGLRNGVATIVTDSGEEKKATIDGGFAEVIGGKVSILTDEASWV